MTWVIIIFKAIKNEYFTNIFVYEDKIYVCGGFDGTTRHSSMEYYDPKTDKWSVLESASVGREGLKTIKSLLFIFIIRLNLNLSILQVPVW